jgi:hypothetical protein
VTQGIIKRDKEFKGDRYSFNFYLKVLKEEILKCFKLDRIFIQNNTFIYTVKKIKKWFKDNTILLLN